VPGSNSSHDRLEDEDPIGQFGHPRGTLAIVIVFGALFALAWFSTYLFLFLERGAPRP
jgi:hypothetical protein